MLYRALLAFTAIAICQRADAYEGGAFQKPASQPAPRVPVLTKPPTVINFVPAAYPEREKGRGNADVILLLYLDDAGNVTKATATTSPSAAFGEVAVAAAMQLKFSPAEVDNLPSPIGLEFKYVFTEDMAASQPAVEAAASAPVKKTSFGKAVLKGEIREAGTRLRLEDVSLRLQVGELDLDGTTDAKGKFEFRDLPPGDATLTVASLKHRKRSVTYKLEPNVELSERNIYIQREVLDPFETIVQGKRDEREVTKRTISREELIKVPGSFGDPLRAIQNLPGVARAPLLGGNLVIRGASPNSSEYYIDGMKLPALFHFGQGPSVIQESFIEDIIFLPCCFSPRYGNATAGIIDISLRKPDPRKWSGKASADFGLARAFLEVPITENTVIQLAARRSYYDAVIPLVLDLVQPQVPSQVSNPIILPVFYDYQARITQHFDHAGDFQLFVFGSDDRLKFAQTPTQQTSAFNPAALQITLTTHSINPQWKLKITPNLQNTLTLQGILDINTANTEQVNFSLTTYTIGVRDEIKYKVNDNINLIMGADGFFEWTTLDTRLPAFPQFPQFPSPGTNDPPFTTLKSTLQTNLVGVYTEADIRLGKKLRVLPGARLDEISYNGRNRQGINPRLSAKYQLLDSLVLKGAVGTFQQRPAPLNILPTIGQTNLDLQNAFHSTLGVDWQITQALSFETSVYANYLWGEAASTNKVNLNDGKIEPVIFDNRQIGRAYGVELLLRHKPYKNFFGWIAYTLSRSERKTDSDWFLFNFDQTHILVIVGSYILPYGFQVGVRFRLISGNPTTPVAGSSYDADTGDYRRVNGAFRSTRLPLFHQLDIRIDKTFDLPWFQVTIYADVQNVYNHVNSEFSQYSFDFSKQQFFSSIPILPVAGLEVKW